jgi:hypothetical protein
MSPALHPEEGTQRSPRLVACLRWLICPNGEPKCSLHAAWRRAIPSVAWCVA